MGGGPGRYGDGPAVDRRAAVGVGGDLPDHGVDVRVHAPGPAAEHAPSGDVLAGAGRAALHPGRGAVRGEVAGTGQPPLRLSRDLPCVHPAGEHRPLLPDVSRGGGGVICTVSQ